MRPTFRNLAAAAAVAVAIFAAACQSSDLPISSNGPNGQSFSTNNALIRFVNGSPTAGSACTVATQTTTCVDVFIDGHKIPSPPGAPGIPYPTVPSLNPFAVLPYISVPAGPVLIQVYQSGTKTLVFEPGNPPPTPAPMTLTAGKKYTFAIAGNAPLPPPSLPFFQGYLFVDGLYQAGFGDSMTDFHNASFNAGSLQYFVTCAACPGGGQNIGNPVGPGGTVGPVSLVPSSNYAFNAKNAATQTITASTLNGLNVNGVIPDPFGKQNVSIYAVDTAGLLTSDFQLIGVEDTNG